MATAVEVSNIPYSSTQADVERALPQPWLSIAHERGKARIEFGTIQIATSAIAAINRIQMGTRKLRATLIASATSGFVQAEAPRSWPAVDPTAKPIDEQTRQNENDFMKYEALKSKFNGVKVLSELSREEVAPFVNREAGAGTFFRELIHFLSQSGHRTFTASEIAETFLG
jgi:hypothetical protein